MSYTGPTHSLVNNLVRFTNLPCAVPYSFMVETAVPSLLDAIWTIIEPDKKEAYHIINGRSAVCTGKSIWEDVERKTGTDAGPVKRIAFNLAEWGDLAVWYLFLAGVAKQFMLEWTSEMLIQTPCDPKASSCSANSAIGAIETLPDAPWQGGEFNWNDSCFLGPRGPATLSLAPGETGTLAAQVSWIDWEDKDVPCQSRIVNLESGHQYDFYDPFVESPDPTAPTLVWWTHTNVSRNVQTLQVQFKAGGTHTFNEIFPKKAFAHVTKG